MEINMTEGSVTKHLIKFMIPLLIGNLFQQFYSMADTFIVGQTLGENALAGVGSTGAISFLIVGFVQGLTCGFAVVTSQMFGAKREDMVRKSVTTSIVLSVILTVFTTVGSYFLIMPLLKIMQTPADIIQYAYDYIIIIVLGLGATVFYNVVSSIVRALGDSKTPLYFLIFACVINIGLDFLFISAFNMGVMGAGVATVISQFLAGLACAVYMFIRYKILRLRREDWKMNGKFVYRHMLVGLPMALQFSITAIGCLVQQAAINSLGNAAIAAQTIASKIDSFATLPLISMGAAIATFVGQNYGAGKMSRVNRCINTSLIITVILSAAGLGFVALTGKPLTRLFIPEATVEVVNMSFQYLVTQGAFYVFLGWIFIYRNVLQGMGRSIIALIAGGVELVARIIVAIVFAQLFGFTGVCLSNPSAWLLAGVYLLIAYYVVIKSKRMKKMMETEKTMMETEKAMSQSAI